MVLVACPECGVSISGQAPTCPKCGRPHDVAANPGSLNDGDCLRVPPPRLRLLNVLISLAFVIYGVYLYVSFIPDHDPKNSNLIDGIAAELRGEQIWVFKREFVSKAYLGSIVMVVLGGLSLLTGSFKRMGKLAFCKRCNRQIVALKSHVWGWKCERCGKHV